MRSRLLLRRSTSLVTLAFALHLATVAQADVRHLPAEPDPRPVQTPAPGAAELALPFIQGFESGAPGWTLSGKWHVRTNPQTTRVSDFIRSFPLVCLPDAGFWPSAFGGQSVLVYSDDAPGTPEEGTFVAPWSPSAQTANNGGQSLVANVGDAISPPIDLTLVSNATLSIRTWFEIESVDPAPSQFDAMLIGVSTDGVNFVNLGYSGPAVDYNGLPCQPATTGGFNLPAVWVEQNFDLTPYVGSTVYLQFRFQTRDHLYNAFRGWFLDDVRVTSTTLTPCEIGSVSPPCSAPGFGVQVQGSGFVGGSQVYIGGVLASPSSVLSTTIIDATVPNLAPGTYSVRVVAPNGSECTGGSLTIDPLHCPSTCSISNMFPNCTATGGHPAFFVTLTGTGFQPGSVVFVGTTSAETIVESSTSIRFRVLTFLPAGTYPIKVVSPTAQECVAPFQMLIDPGICPTPTNKVTWGRLKQHYR